VRGGVPYACTATATFLSRLQAQWLPVLAIGWAQIEGETVLLRTGTPCAPTIILSRLRGVVRDPACLARFCAAARPPGSHG
jgi:hypothetical protein